MRPLVLVVSALAAVALAGCGGGTEEGASPPAQATRPAPEVEGLTLDGERLSLDSFRGRPVLVNVWSSW